MSSALILEQEKWNESDTFAYTTMDIFDSVRFLFFFNIMDYSRVLINKSHLWIKCYRPVEQVMSTFFICHDAKRRIILSLPRIRGKRKLNIYRLAVWFWYIHSILPLMRLKRILTPCRRSMRRLEMLWNRSAAVTLCNCSIKALWCPTIIPTHQKGSLRAPWWGFAVPLSVQTAPGSLCNYVDGVFVFIG